MKRRDFFGLGAGAAAALAFPSVAVAQKFDGSIDEVVIATPKLILIDTETLDRLHSLGQSKLAGVEIRPGGMVAADDVTVPLLKKNIDSHTFYSEQVDLALTPADGLVTFVRGTPLNFDANGDGVLDSIRTVVNYRCR